MNKNNASSPQEPFTDKFLEKCKSSRKLNPKYGALWEYNVYKGVKECLDQCEDGVAIRLYKPKFTRQFIDILVDGAGGEYYAIECKTSTKMVSHPGHWFTRNKGVSQLEEEEEFLRRSGRVGIIAYMMPGLNNGETDFHSYLIPWPVMIGELWETRVTAGHLDELVDEGYVLKIPTNDGTVHLHPDTFCDLLTTLQLYHNEMRARDEGVIV